MEDKNKPVSDTGLTSRCLFCAEPLASNFTVVHGKITRLKRESADNNLDDGDDEDKCFPSTSGFSLSTEDSLLDKQLEVVFILRNILRIPEIKLEGFLKQFGGQLHPEFWCQVCSTCGGAVQQFYETLKEISGLKRKLSRISNKLRCQIHNTKEVGGGGEGSNRIWEEVRAEVLKDFKEVLAAEAVASKSSHEEELIKGKDEGIESTSDFEPDRDEAEDIMSAFDVEHDDDDSKSNLSSHSEDLVLKKQKRTINTKANHFSLKKGKRSRPSKRFQSSPSRKRNGSLSSAPLYTNFRKGHLLMYKCSLCSAPKFSKEKMLVHLTLHKSGKGSPCSQCGWLISTRSMTKHVGDRHPEISIENGKKSYRYTCSKCPAVSAVKNSMVQHLKLHEPSNMEEMTTCKLCGWLVKTKSLPHHMASPHHGRTIEEQGKAIKITNVTTGIPYYCDFCPMIKPSFEQLLKHFERYHAVSEELVACIQPTCQQKFQSKQLLKFHMKEAHADVQIEEETPEEKGDQKCPHCELLFNSKLKKDYHIAEKHKDALLTCFTCDVKMRSYNEYRTHMKTSAHAASRTYYCECCGKSFRSAGAFETHQKQEHHEELGLEPLAHQDKNHSCQFCGQTFRVRQSLLWHIQGFHEGPLANPVIPDGKHFRLEKGADGGETWLCEFCTAKFPNRDTVRSHILRNHSSKVKFICEGCGKKYAASMGLHQHRKSCKEVLKKCGTPKFACVVCSKPFWTSLQQYKHQRNVHKNQEKACRKCGVVFPSFGTLEKHQNKCKATSEAAETGDATK